MTPLRPIRIMPPELALTIAAGEVVERPASAVKELLDNALDAGASAIRVEIREAGLKLIRVADDGHGIPSDQIELAFTSHATSKISTLDDLQKLNTLGFRGEALPSIAAVSRVEVQTHAEGESAGARLDLEYGEIRSRGSCAAPPGTRVAVSDLFSNVPARRAFIRSTRAESAQIHGVVAQYALAHPGVRFSLTAEGRPTFQSPGTGRPEDAFAAVYGVNALQSMLQVRHDERDVLVEGLIALPEQNRPNRSAIHLFVNGRPVQNRSLAFALEEAYSGFLMVGRHPLAAVHLRLPASDVDSNVHPSKTEVRFARDREVHGVLHRAVAAALLETRLTARELTPAAKPLEPPGTEGRQAELPVAAPYADTPSLLHPVPALRVFGQANQMFIIAEGPAGLYMIDQHAAHERVLYDQLDEQSGEGDVLAQPLLEPLCVDLSPAQIEALELNRGLLEGLGFSLEPFGTDACLVRAVPVLARSRSPAELASEVLSELTSALEPRAARERALAMVACKAAVKAGQVLGVDEMRQLVSQLERTPRPDTCPHGRPTMVHLSNARLEREFGR